MILILSVNCVKMMMAENGSPSIISDDHLKKLVDSCKRNKQDRSLTELAKDREGR